MSARAEPPLESTQDLLKDKAVSYLKDLTSPEHPQVDIVAVHGLRIPFNLHPWKEAHAFGVNSWTTGKPGHEVLWLKDLLPKRISNARVLLFGYNSNVGWDTSSGGVSGAAEDLLAKLKHKQRNAPGRPIIFVCHSLGGIVVKHAVSKARSSPQYHELYQNIRAIAFFATPHRGGLGAKQGQAIAGALRRITGNLRNSIMEALRQDSLITLDIHQYFLDSLSDANIRVCSLYEARTLSILNHLVVEPHSAMLGLPFPQEVTHQVPESDHSSVCKFETETLDYHIIVDHLQDLVDWAVNPSMLDRSHASWAISVPSPADHRGSSSSLSSDTYLVNRRTSSLDFLGVGDQSSTPVISRFSVDENIRGPPFYLVPNVTNAKFTGRESIISLVQGILSMNHDQQLRLALYGLGGVGKTQIALKVASWFKKQFPERSIFWIRAGSAALFLQSLEDLAIICNLINPENEGARPIHEVQKFLLNEKNGKWLMIVDNADNTDSFSNPIRTSSTHFPGGGGMRRIPIFSQIPKCVHGQVIFTTNSKAIGEQLTLQGKAIEVRNMDEQDACELLRKLLDDSLCLPESPPSYQRESPNVTDIEKLCKHLEYLPLALSQAAAYMRQQSLTVTEYIQLLEIDNESTVSHLLDQDFQSYGVEDGFSKAVASTWKVAFDQIESKWPDAAKLLSLMAFLDSQSIPKFLLRGEVPDEREFTASALGTLQGYALINLSPDNKSLNIHRLVQIAMKNRLTAPELANEFASKALKLIDNNFPSQKHQTLANASLLLPHALKVLENKFTAPSDKVLVGSLASKVSWYYQFQGYFTEAENLSQIALENILSAPSASKEQVLAVKDVQARVFRYSGRFKDGEKVAGEVWQGRKKELGENHVDTLESYNLVALFHQDQGYYMNSQKITRSAMKTVQKNPPPDDTTWGRLAVARAKLRQGTSLHYVGKYKESIRLLRDAVDAYSDTVGPTHIVTLKVKWRLAWVLQSVGEYAESTELSTQVWKVQKAELGQDHPDTLKTLLVVASNLQATGNTEKALSYKRLIYSKAVSGVGENHVYTIVAALNLAESLLYARREQVEAKGDDLEEQVSSKKEMGEEKYLSEDKDTTAKQNKELEDLFHCVLEGTEKLFRPDHPDALEAKTGIATMLRYKGNLEEAERLQREAIDKLKRLLGKAHPLTLDGRENLARVLWAQKATKGKEREARKQASKTLKGREERLGWNHPDTQRIAALVVEMLPEGKKRESIKEKVKRVEKVTQPEDQTPVTNFESRY